MEFPWLTALLQTGDALFPTGAYAHSLGFEEAARLGLVQDEATLKDFLRLHILPVQERQELPYLRWCYTAAERGDWTDLACLEAEISAWKLVREVREASLQLGGRRLKSLQAICSAPVLRAYANERAAGRLPGHHLAVFAVQAVALGMPLEAALTAWLYQSLAAVCGAALKLLRVGQEAGQRALRAAVEQGESVVVASLQVLRNQASSFDPLLEIAGMRHAYAEERLFIS